MTHVFNKPFLKWLGGKSEICEQIADHFPKDFSSFHDVFLGSGSVLIHVLHLLKETAIRCDGPICAYDTNKALIATFKNVQASCDDLIIKCNELQETYNNSSNQSDLYYTLRTQYNAIVDKNMLDASALFIFLNKTCFRGIYRESRKSGFNVPFGNYLKVTLVDSQHIHHLSLMFQNVQFYSQSYEITLQSLEPGALVYLDPPYLPIKSSSFVSYTDKGFSKKEHTQFFQLVMKLHLRKIFFVMSDSFNEQIIKLFQDFVIQTIVCKRKITPKKPTASCEELIISNANKIFGSNETSSGSRTNILSLLMS